MFRALFRAVYRGSKIKYVQVKAASIYSSNQRVCLDMTAETEASTIHPATAAGVAGSGGNSLGSVMQLPEPVKGFSDKKEYRSIRLRNGLRALLISDHVRHGPPAAAAFLGDDEEEPEAEEEGEESGDENESDNEEIDDSEGEDEEEESNPKKSPDGKEYKAAASLSVSWGSCEDPPELPGLMHFLEHMVFMGSKKYPSENSFDDFVRRHGGCDNAYTDFEHTNFHFDIHESYLWEGLDRFSQFFVEPLMKKNAMSRERNAVDSEFTIALPNDDNREQQLISTLAPPDHPAANFTWGNAASLSSKPDDEVHRTLHAQREKYYSAQFMTLAVQSRHSLDEMERQVDEIFSKIPNNGFLPEDRDHYAFPFPPSAVNKIIYVEPMKAKHVLTAAWFLPSMNGRYKTQPLRFLANIIGHEGFGSLLSFYKQKNWAYSLECESEMGDFEDGSFCCQMKVIIELTDEGFPVIDDVLFSLFQYIALLRAQPSFEIMFKEYQQLAKLNFDFEVESEAMQNVEYLTAAMLKYVSEDYLSGSTLLFAHDPASIKDTLDRFTPDSVNVVVRSKLLDLTGPDVCTEKWFGTKYRVQDFSETQRKLFASAESVSNPQLHLPLPNVYIPNDFSLLSAPDSKPEYPSRLVTNSHSGSLFYLPDHKFELPIVQIRLQFLLEKKPCRLQENYLNIMSLFLQCYRYQLMEPLYEATLAKYNYSIGYSHDGLIIHLSGSSQHIERVLNVLMEYLLKFSSNFREEHFRSLKILESQKLYNEAIKPTVMRKQLRLHLLIPMCNLSLHHLQLLQAVTGEDVLSCASDLLQNSQVNMLIQGNVTETAARDLYNGILEKIPRATEPVEHIEIPGYRVLKSGVTIVRARSVNEADGNSAIVNYYQGSAGTLRDQVLSDYLLCTMEEQCFDHLRTHEQLSYAVHSQGNESNGVIGWSISLVPQAEKFTVTYVDSRVETFIEKFATSLREMSDSAFATFKETVLQMKKIDDLNLGEEVCRNWSEIVRKEYMFDRLQRHIEIVESITKDDLVNFFLSLVDATSADYRKLSIQVIGEVDHKNRKPPPMEQLVEGGLSCIRFEPEDETDKSSYEGKKFYVCNCLDYIGCLQEMPHHPII